MRRRNFITLLGAAGRLAGDGTGATAANAGDRYLNMQTENSEVTRQASIDVAWKRPVLLRAAIVTSRTASPMAKMSACQCLRPN
jgi:hypothetical protein